MKRVGYLYEQLCDKELIRQAIYLSSRHKLKRKNVRKILNNVDLYVDKLYDMFVNQEVVFGRTHEVDRWDNSCRKMRHITVPNYFPDQIIHWAIIIVLKPIICKGMYSHTCGSVPGRGGHAAKQYIEKVLRNDNKIKYVSKLDIHHFFPSIKPEIMLKLFERKIKDKKMLNLIDKILKHGGDNLPIGFYTSKWFSNFYLENIDRYIKEELKIKYYVRYVDDIVWLDTNKRKMRKAILALNNKLKEYNLSLKDNYQTWKLDSRPIDFVGYRFYKEHTYLRKRIFYRLNRRVKKAKREGHITISQPQGIISLLGWLKTIRYYSYYERHIKSIITKEKLQLFVGRYSEAVNLQHLSSVQQRKLRGTMRMVV